MKIQTVVIVAVLFAFAAVSYGQTTEELINEAFSFISTNEITQDARILTGQDPFDAQTIHSRHISHPDHEIAQQYLLDRLTEMGNTPTVETFETLYGDGGNLIVEIPGTTEPDVIWILGAHFDSTNGVDPMSPAQGAVDNASGVIITIQVLKALMEYQFENTLRFILFDAEEVGLIGSEENAKASAQRGDNIELMVNLDVPGWRMGNINAAFANSDLASWPYMQAMNDIPRRYDCGTSLIGVPVEAIDTANMASFWDYGYRGLMVGSLYQLTGWMNTAEDTFEKLDLEQCANISRIITAYLGEKAGILGPVDPDDDDDDDTTSDDDDDDDNDDDTTESDSQSDDEDDDEACCG